MYPYQYENITYLKIMFNYSFAYNDKDQIYFSTLLYPLYEQKKSNCRIYYYFL